MHGDDMGAYAYGLWPTVAFHVLLFLFFVLSFVKPTSKFEWRSMGAFIGFIAALFTEMYGFPLTIYILTGAMGHNYPALNPFSHPAGHLSLVFLGLEDSAIAMSVLHLITNAMIFFGFYLIYQGWALIHAASEDTLVTTGVYAYIRHPQYIGMWLITVGLLIQWPTLITLIMWPILMFAYYKLSMSEEEVLKKTFGEEFERYKRNVPAFFPKFSKEITV